MSLLTLSPALSKGTEMENSTVFDPNSYIKNIGAEPDAKLLSDDGSVLPGIMGLAGAAEVIENGWEIGIDRLKMESGSAFELHTHPGAHILYVLKSRGFIRVDGVDYELGEGDTVYVPASYVHGIKTNPLVSEPFELLAFGVPHMPISSRDRMTLVDEDERRVPRSDSLSLAKEG
jgi:quercetin dioxygenase-like cupin family protein